MNTKSIFLTLMLCAVLIGLAGIRLSTQASTAESSTGAPSIAGDADDSPNDTVELILSFEIRIRLPILKKDAI